MSKIYKDSYRFIAVFHFADDGISISFPNLPGCIPCADTEDEALKTRVRLSASICGGWNRTASLSPPQHP